MQAESRRNQSRCRPNERQGRAQREDLFPSLGRFSSITHALALAELAVLPHAPGSRAGSFQLVEYLLVSERIHALPKAVITLRPNLALGDQSLERFVDQFLSRLDVAKDLLSQHEVTSIDPNVGVLHAFDRPDGAVIVQMNSVQAARPRLHGEKRGVTIATGKFLNHFAAEWKSVRPSL